MSESREDQMKQTAVLALDLATAQGAAQAVVRMSHSSFAQAAFRDGSLEKATASSRQGLSLQLFIEGRYGVHSTSDLRPEALGPFVIEAAELTRLLEPDPLRSLPPAERMARAPGPELGLHDPDTAQAPAELWLERARLLEGHMARDVEASPHQAASVQSGAYGEESVDLLANSQGFMGLTAETACYYSASVALMDPQRPGARQLGYWAEIRRAMADLGGEEAMAALTAKALRRAERQLGARPGPSGKAAVLIENTAAVKLVQDLLACMAGSAVDQKRSWLADDVGRAIGGPLMTVRDEPFIPGGLGSRWFDGEGMAVAPRPLVEGGVLRTLLLDTYYARRLNAELSGAATGNLLMPASTAMGCEGLMAGMARGLVVTSFLGGNFNPTTGDFSFGVRGLWVEGGKVAHAVCDMNMAGNYRELWASLAAVGNDPQAHSRIGTPSLLFEGVQLAGA